MKGETRLKLTVSGFHIDISKDETDKQPIPEVTAVLSFLGYKGFAQSR